MSYCRKSAESDVYVIASVSGTMKPTLVRTAEEVKALREQLAAKPSLWICIGCSLSDGVASHEEHSPGAMIEHLLRHRSAGHRVPDAAIDRLKSECD